MMQPKIPSNKRHVELPSLTYTELEWQDQASCRGANTDAFFQEEIGAKANYSAQRVMCAQCPVRLECLDFALNNHIKYGLWGGIAPRNRRDVGMGRASKDLTVTQIVRDLRKLKADNPIAQASVIFKTSEKTIRERLRQNK
jgi:WhiB family redox-sensing transcriptional regulator